jgi:AcrR family transcriptional regulator
MLGAMAPALTVKGAATRDRIILGAAQLIRAEGAGQIGLDDIRAATSTSKSQLFHYFPEGRAELLHAVAVHEAGEVIADQQPFLGRLGPDPLWRQWRDVVVRKYAEQGTHCPLSALTQQLGPSAPAIRPVVAELLECWHSLIADGVRRSGVDPSVDPDGLAASILAAIQGGVVMLQATGRISYLEAALDRALVPLGLPA